MDISEFIVLYSPLLLIFENLHNKVLFLKKKKVLLPGTVLGMGVKGVNKPDKNPYSHGH
jgi:hypothetical protein